MENDPEHANQQETRIWFNTNQYDSWSRAFDAYSSLQARAKAGSVWITVSEGLALPVTMEINAALQRKCS